MEVWVGAPETISGAKAVREQFTVSGTTKEVSSVSLRVARTRGSDPLTVRLENGDGSMVEEGTIPATAVPITPAVSYVWAKYNFTTKRALVAGQSYHLVLAAPASSTYQAFPIRKGSGYGFSATTLFADGNAEFTAGGTWTGWTQWGVDNRTDGDL